MVSSKAAALAAVMIVGAMGAAIAQDTPTVYAQTEQALRAKLKSAYAGKPARFGFENFKRRSNGKDEAVCGQATIYIGRDKPSLVRFVYRYNSGDAAIETLNAGETATVQKLWQTLCLRGRVIE
jgi:opacity protein-like surface antigen